MPYEEWAKGRGRRGNTLGQGQTWDVGEGKALAGSEKT